jgi:hypothetical protein
VGRLHQWVQNNIFKKNKSVGFRISETAEANIPSQTKSHGTASLFPN